MCNVRLQGLGKYAVHHFYIFKFIACYVVGNITKGCYITALSLKNITNVTSTWKDDFIASQMSQNIVSHPLPLLTCYYSMENISQYTVEYIFAAFLLLIRLYLLFNFNTVGVVATVYRRLNTCI